MDARQAPAVAKSASTLPMEEGIVVGLVQVEVEVDAIRQIKYLLVASEN